MEGTIKINAHLNLLTVMEITDSNDRVRVYTNETVVSAFPELARRGGISRIPCKYMGKHYFASVSINRNIQDSILNAILYNVTALDFIREVEDCICGELQCSGY